MLVRRMLAAIIVLQALTVPASVAIGGPTITIDSPADGSVLATRSVNVTGTAAGSDAEWVQTSQADFDAGAKENITSSSDGNVSLNGLVYDDFNDNSLDAGRWSWRNVNGIRADELNGMIILSGTSTTSSYWAATSDICATQATAPWASADIRSFSGTGSGYNTAFTLWQNAGTEAGLSFEYDSAVSSNILVKWIVWTGGVLQSANLGVMTACPHNLRLEYFGGNLYAYLDGAMMRSGAVSLVNFKTRIYACARYSGNTVATSWDNVTSGFARSGSFTSAAFDTLSSNPVLKKVGWSADTPSGTGVSVQLRSSDYIYMSSPTPWTTVANGQSTGLPAAKRYIQYRAALTSSDGYWTPAFNDITIDYTKDVKKVELSIDDQASWVSAIGTEKWYALLEMPENQTTIWVRATDVAGEEIIASVTVDVDTTPPSGSIEVDKGEAFTSNRQVRISCVAQDSYGVASVILSQDRWFSDADWVDYSTSVPFTLSEGDGTKTVYARFMDVHGLESPLVNDSIFLDTTPPKGSVAIEGGAKFTRNATVTLSLNATDASGVEDMKVSDYKDLAGEDWRPFKSALQWELPPGSGERTVYVLFRSALGQESEVASDSIILDTLGPDISVTINGGSAYTNSTAVTLRLNATDNYRVNNMEISMDPSFAGASAEPFSEERNWTLSPGDGVKTVYARAVDAAGNIGRAKSSSITLDTTAPSCVVSQLPFTVNATNFAVKWSGTDATSGISFFDVQYRDGAGEWTDWLVRTNLTRAVFSGTDGHDYSFRVRAQDALGNLEGFTEAGSTPVLVRLAPPPQPPAVSIIRPLANSTLKGLTDVTGTSYHPESGMSVKRVLIRIDGGPLRQASGTGSWTFSLDTTTLTDGKHALTVQAFDGTRYSNNTTREFIVKNAAAPPISTSSALLPWIVLMIAVIVAVGLAVFLATRRRHAPQYQPLPPAGWAAPQRAQTFAPMWAPPSAPPAVPAPPPPTEQAAFPAEAGGRMTVVGKVRGDELKEVLAPGPEKTPEPWRAVEEAAREWRILRALSSLPRGLPSSLWGMKMEELAAAVAAAETKVSPEGGTIVRINTRWYYGDEKNLGLFMQEYKGPQPLNPPRH
jgi:hypothetical protein